MRNLYILGATAVLFVLASCSQTLKVDPVSFGITTASTTYNTGDTVNFTFTGQPDMITFYSGVPGSNYEYRTRTNAQGQVQMQFTSLEKYGTQDSTLRLLISTNFGGQYDSANVYQATWTDITDKATLSTHENTISSGIIDLSNYVTAGQSFYFAFKYAGTKDSTQKTWTITNYGINLLLADSTTSAVATMTSPGWTAVRIKGSAAWSVSATQLLIKGGGSTAPDNEDWVITGPINPYQVSPDRGSAIKDITENVYKYSFVYTKPGSYQAVFVGTNATSDGEKSVTKTVNLTIH